MTTDSDLVRRLSELTRLGDASGGVTAALLILADHVERMEQHQIELEEKLAALRAQHMPPAHFPTRVEELAADRAQVNWR